MSKVKLQMVNAFTQPIYVKDGLITLSELSFKGNLKEAVDWLRANYEEATVNSYLDMIVDAHQGIEYDLDELIKNPNWRIRLAVAELGFGLDTLINDPDWKVRQAVAEQGFGLDVLTRDREHFVRETATQKLSPHPNPTAMEQTPTEFYLDTVPVPKAMLSEIFNGNFVPLNPLIHALEHQAILHHSSTLPYLDSYGSRTHSHERWSKPYIDRKVIRFELVPEQVFYCWNLETCSEAFTELGLQALARHHLQQEQKVVDLTSALTVAQHRLKATKQQLDEMIFQLYAEGLLAEANTSIGRKATMVLDLGLGDSQSNNFLVVSTESNKDGYARNFTFSHASKIIAKQPPSAFALKE